MVTAEIEQLESQLADEISQWEWGAIARAVYQERSAVFRNALKTRIFHIPTFLRLGDLLMRINMIRPSGSLTDGALLTRVLELVDRLGSDYDFLDEWRTRRYVMLHSRVMQHENGGFFLMPLAYLGAYQTDLRSSGLVGSVEEQGNDDLFAYFDLDLAAADIESGHPPEDVTHRFQTFLPTVFQIDRMLRRNARTAAQYAHQRNPLAGSVLHGWYEQCGDPSKLYREYDPELAKSLDTHFADYVLDDYSGQDFVAEYIDSPELVPVAVRVPDGLIMDRLTLLFFNIYLYGQVVPTAYRDVAGYARALAEWADRRGRLFNGWLKAQVESVGLSCAKTDLVKRADGEEFEYDVIAVDERSQTVYLLEGKFKDIAPSSISGRTLVPNVLEGRNGLLHQSQRHSNRARFVREHLDLFRSDIPCKRKLEDYQIEALIVSKATPPIHRFDDIRLVEISGFLTEVTCGQSAGLG